MTRLDTMSQIIEQKQAEVTGIGNPDLMDAENKAIMEQKRMSLDEPMTEVKKDPLR